MKHFICIILLFGLTLFHNTILLAQDNGSDMDLLDALGNEEETEYITNAFKSPRVINSHSIEMLATGALDFRILHRFGRINQGWQEFWGLDNASMRMGFDYGILPNLTVGIGRSTAKKELDGFLKYRILWQSKGKKAMPFSLVWVSGITYNGQSKPFSQPDIEATPARRIAYYHQLIIGRKFNSRFSLQITPTMVHRNIVDNVLVPNNLYAIGVGGRVKFSNRMAFVWDYSYPINRFPQKIDTHPLSLGLDIETGGHVFQLHFSNAVGMNERAFISDENGNWFKGDIQFGFNLSRVFQVKKNKVKAAE